MYIESYFIPFDGRMVVFVGEQAYFFNFDDIF